VGERPLVVAVVAVVVVVRGVLALMVGYLNNVHVHIYSNDVYELIFIF